MRATNGRILCVDDDADTRMLLSALLGRSGYEVKTASGVAEGLRLAESERFSLYVLDNRFEDGTGLELCRRVREFDEQTPVVFFSGLAYESDCRRGMDAGAQAYMVKPGDIGRLVETVTRLTRSNDRETNSRSAPYASA